MKKFITIFPECEKVHLKKDVGMLPYSLSMYTDYSCGIVTYKKNEFTTDDIHKYNIVQIQKKKNDTIDFFDFILHNGKSISVLNLYHITSRRNLWWILAYRIVNPKGKVYIKLDADYRMIDMVDMHPRTLKRKIKKFTLTKMVDLYTVESIKMYRILKTKWGINLRILPNGVFREHRIPPAVTDRKENIFLTVGRLGTEQKATEDLLEAFRRIKDKTDWRLVLVGTVDEKFERIKDRYFAENQDLIDRVVFTGPIEDETALTNIYMKAKVFVLPSKWESFGLVLLEAVECGDYLVLSDQIPSSEDVGRDGKYATVVSYHDILALSEAMLVSTKRNINDEELSEMNNWIYDKFSWRTIVKKLDYYLKDIDKK